MLYIGRLQSIFTCRIVYFYFCNVFLGAPTVKLTLQSNCPLRWNPLSRWWSAIQDDPDCMQGSPTVCRGKVGGQCGKLGFEPAATGTHAWLYNLKARGTRCRRRRDDHPPRAAFPWLFNDVKHTSLVKSRPAIFASIPFVCCQFFFLFDYLWKIISFLFHPITSMTVFLWQVWEKLLTENGFNI